MIKQELLRVKEGLELNRMPTRSECIDFLGSYGLSVAVSRRQGGWCQLAKDLGLPIKESETTLGKSYEIKIARLLEEAGHSVKRMSQNFPYDLLVDDLSKSTSKPAIYIEVLQGISIRSEWAKRMRLAISTFWSH